jgi:hypothetical protein
MKRSVESCGSHRQLSLNFLATCLQNSNAGDAPKMFLVCDGNRVRLPCAPRLYQGAIGSIKGIGRGQGYPRNGSASTFHVTVRVATLAGADHLEAIIPSQAPMAHPGRNHQHIAAFSLKSGPS